MHEKFRGSLVKSYLIECLSIETVSVRFFYFSSRKSTLLGAASVAVNMHMIVQYQSWYRKNSLSLLLLIFSSLTSTLLF